MSKPVRYTLTIHPTPDRSDPDGVRRLRRVLKSLLRAYGFRCERCEPTPDEKEESYDANDC